MGSRLLQFWVAGGGAGGAVGGKRRSGSVGECFRRRRVRHFGERRQRSNVIMAVVVVEAMVGRKIIIGCSKYNILDLTGSI
jgi:hypothetical protein